MAWFRVIHRKSPSRIRSGSHGDAAGCAQRLGNSVEAFREPLRDRSGCTNVFRLGEKSGCPDSVAFLEWFIREVGFRVGKLLGCRLGFVFLISIFYEGWEGASPAGVYPFGVLPSCVPFCLAVGLTADTAAREASGHFYGDAQQTSLSSDDVISRQQVDALDTLINKSDTSSRLIPYLYANI